MKRAWALSHACDWWRADSSRRLVMGSLRRAGSPASAEEGAPAPVRLVCPPAPAELAGLGILVSFPSCESAPEPAQPSRLDQPPL